MLPLPPTTPCLPVTEADPSPETAAPVAGEQVALWQPGTNHAYLSKQAQRSLGAYYTPQTTAEFLAQWAVRRSGDQLLEPSFGDGSLLYAAERQIRRAGLRDVALMGIELNGEAITNLHLPGLSASLQLRQADFLEVSPFPVDVVLGNPPYVRLRQLADRERQRALAAAAHFGGMEPSGSLWMPFVLHALRFLRPGGRMALVLPYELTYVKYARPLWSILGQAFGHLRLIRSHERLFKDIYQEVVLLLAEDFGQQARHVHFEAYEHVADLTGGRAAQVQRPLPLGELRKGKRLFLDALVPAALRSALGQQLAAITRPAREFVRFSIGYVAGDKAFFHPPAAVAAAFDLPAYHLRPTLTSARVLKGAGLYTATAPASAVDTLFLPVGDSLTAGEERYVALGQQQGVAARYKCQVRTPWYRVPGIAVPDVVLSVFTERPVLLVNDARYLASNSLLCGYCRVGSPAELAAAWYTSLTLLQCELEVHALGGGVMVLIPGEAGKLRMPTPSGLPTAHLPALHALLQAGKVAEAYQLGDDAILMQHLGLSRDMVALLRAGIAQLTHWRTSAKAK